jgi:hypothetical protein
MAPEMAKELKALQQENARLKKVVANQALDMEILREAAKGNCRRSASSFGAGKSFGAASLSSAEPAPQHATVSTVSCWG